MATAKFVEKGQHPSSSSSTAPVSVSSHISPATTNVPLDQNQIVITTSEKLSAGDPHTSLLEQQPTQLNGGSRPMSRTDSVKNFFNKVVNQIAVSSSKVQVKIGRGGSGASEADSKADAAQRRRAEEWRLYFEESQGRVPGVIGM